MLLGTLIHPEILHALGSAGHGSQILISDGNFPHSTTLGPNAALVCLNLMPGVVSATDALAAIVSAVPIEAAAVMQPMTDGTYAMKNDPPIWAEFNSILHRAGFTEGLTRIERFEFYVAAAQPQVCLVVATAEQQVYANLLLTIGVVRS